MNTSSDLQHQSLQNNHSSLGRLSANIEQWQSLADLYQHAVLVLDSSLWPVCMNQALRDRLANRYNPGLDSDIWKACCDQVGELVRETRNRGAKQFSETITIKGWSFAVLGSLLFAPDRSFDGSIISIADPSSISSTVGPGSHELTAVDSSDAAEYEQWVKEARVARERTRNMSRREREVAGFVMDGKSNREIATCLGVGIKTIEKHRSNAIKRTNANSTAELVRICLLAGIRGPEVTN